MDQLELIQCKVEDLAKLKAIGIETYKATFEAQNTSENMKAYLDTAYAESKLLEELQTVDSFFYFLQAGAQTVGYLKLNVNQAQTEEIAENSLEVERIYIRKAHCRKGYGRYLLQAAEEKARALEKSSVWLGVWEYNLNARAFYEKMGFKRVSQHAFFMGDDEQTDFILLKNIV